MEETRHGSPVVDKTAALLNALGGAAAGGVSLADLATHLDVPRSTVYRILNSLRAHGFVARVNDSAKYALGPRFVELARSISPGADRATIIEIARPILQSAAERIGESFKLSAPEGYEMMTLFGAPSPREYSLSLKIGSRSPKHVGAAGKLALAFASDEVVDEYCSRGLEARTSHTITDAVVLREVLQRVRVDGYAEDMQESGPGIRAVAAPIFSASGKMLAAVSVPFVGDPTPERLRQMRRTVIEAAREITAALGG